MTERPADMIRRETKEASDEVLMGVWKANQSNMNVEALALSAIIEAELENRGVIKLNEETMEYEILQEV